MKKITLISLLVCVCINLQAQTNFVKNPGLERYDTCPNTINRINWCKHWSIPGDSVSTSEFCLEYYNVCGNDSADYAAHVPDNGYFYGYPHSGNGMAGSVLYYDKIHAPASYWPFNYRDNLVGRLYRNLTAGKSYCVSFWTIMAESSGYAHNKIGAYLDDGSINIVDTFGEEISDIRPQVFTNAVLIDTVYWTKIEGSFVASGTEKYITIGNFFPNDSVTTIATDYRKFLPEYSYYLIDDVSVIPIDLNADAGKDSHAEPGKPVQIGRVGDTTAQGLDCKWYYKGALIDSGAVISVKGTAIVGTIDTYVVVQTICGLVKTDTVRVTTVPVGMKDFAAEQTFNIFPNPSNGNLTITTASFRETAQCKIYGFLGQIINQQVISFSNNVAKLNLHLTRGTYVVELTYNDRSISRKRIIIE